MFSRGLCGFWLLYAGLLVLAISASALETPKDVFIESAVYDVNMEEDGFSGYCMLTLSRHVPLEDMSFLSNTRVSVITSGYVVDSDEGILHLGGLEGTPNIGGSRRIILRFRGYYSNGSVNLPVLNFPYVIGRSLFSVSCGMGDISCKPQFASFPLGSSEKVLASEGVSSETVTKLDSDFLQLRSLTTSSVESPAYRFYIGLMSEDMRLEASCSKSKKEDNFPFSVLLVAGGAAVVVSYFVYRRLRPQAETDEKSFLEPTKEKQASWQTSIESLAGDEREIYMLIAGSSGQMLQKDICKTTGFSKAKVSRLIDRLEQRKLAERTNHGITRKVILKR